MMNPGRLVLLLQLPVPPPGLEPVDGNVPLAAAYLKLHAIRQGLEDSCRIDILPPEIANTRSDQGLIEEILSRDPWMVGFTCYLWNIDRTLWIASRLKERRPGLVVVIGGPEVTADNGWVLGSPAIDYAVLGEGEQTFAELLSAFGRPQGVRSPLGRIDGLWQSAGGELPSPRRPLESMDAVFSPYLEGIVALDGGRRMLLETARGCRFRCKYCFYPKHYDAQRFLSHSQVLANLRYAAEHGTAEVVLLDPTLNQRPDFREFLHLLAEGNSQRQFSYSGELRAEGIDGELARLLRQANFHEVEIGLQSIEPKAWRLMGRPTNLPAFESGVKAMIGEGIKVCVDLILGLPGDTVDSVRRAIDYLCDTQACSEVQAFNLSILPGTAFREEAASLGLKYQRRPPYYLLGTPTLDIEQMFMLMEEVQDAFGVEFDAIPPVQWTDREKACRVELGSMGAGNAMYLPPAADRPQAFAMWLRSADFHADRQDAARLIAGVLADNPHSTLQVVLEPTAAPQRLTAETLELLLATCYENPTYLDRYYSLHPGRLLGAKRLIILLSLELRERLGEAWREMASNWATLVWTGAGDASEELQEYEYVIPPAPRQT